MSRHYFASRRAYWPRLWPIIVLSAPLMLALSALLAPGDLFANLAISIAVGGGAMAARIAVWRHRHPVIRHDQYVEDLRRAAWWN